MAPRNTRVKALAQLEEQPVKDYDPEGEISQDDGGSDSGSEESVDENAGTEHYVSVGDSKLRQKDAPALGASYRGSRVSRAALQETSDEDEDDEEDALDGGSGSEEFDDPDEADLEADQDDEDAEIESDNALTHSDVDRFKDFKFRGSKIPKTTKERLARRPKAADFLSSDEDEGSEDLEDDEGVNGLGEDSDEEMENGVEGSEDEEEDDEEEDEDDEDDDEDDDDESEGSADGDADDQRAELRKIMTEGQKSIVATISQAAKADAEKGQAVRQQRRAFDGLLNIRIRLQKALVAANSIDTVEVDEAAAKAEEEEHKEPYEAAEEAAIKLLNSIDGFRRSMLPESARAKIGSKRKRADFDSDETSQAIWEGMEQTEALALAHRRKVLDKWSSKVRTTTAMTSSRKLGPATTQSLVSILDDQLLGSSDRLIKRTRTPRSCAPVQATKKVAEDASIYDDADFYQLLLKELVDQRTLDSASGTTDGAGVTVRWAALKEAKTRKQVDRKASKGRKMRYTVHERLQNFMAPEDRRSWEQDAVDRFFGTLFGQKMELGEEEEGSDEEMGGASVADEGLRLFKN